MLEVPLTSEQAWFLNVIYPEVWNPNRWTMTALYQLPHDVDCRTVEDAVRDIWNAHSSLRATFSHSRDGWRQRIAERPEAVPFRRFDARAIPRDQTRIVAEQIAVEVSRMVNVEAGRLARFALVVPGAGDPPYLVMSIHHLVVDGISFEILERDLEAAYKSRSSGKVFASNSLPFEEYANKIQEFSKSSELERELKHWIDLPWEDLTRIPTRAPTYNVDSVRNARNQSVNIPVDAANRIAYEVPRDLGATAQDLLIAAAVDSVTSLSGRDLCVKIVHNGRVITCDSPVENHRRESDARSHLLHPRVANTVGWLATCGAVVLPSRGEHDAATYIKRIRDAMRSIPNNGISFGLLRWVGRPDLMRERIDANAWGPQLQFNFVGRSRKEEPDRFLRRLSVPSEESYSAHSTPPELGVIAQFYDQGLRTIWSYDRHLHEESMINSFTSRFRDALWEYSKIGE